ncbi:hypothetical protein [Pseudomonas tohonis]|uniref:hypothetical protein n=1 Tax=Pseudomonas tohonis TaxID=2725477 RepID=UPI001565F89B|nr:hypothetical protein [Pseudomonas tohonis]
MRGPQPQNRRHSTPDEDPRRRMWPRFLGSLAIFGLLVGLMIGRLTAPGPIHLERVEALPDGLALWFDGEPRQRAEHMDGALAFIFDASAEPQKGRLQLGGKALNWRLQMTRNGLLLHFVATRPLHGEWSGAEVDGKWRLQISLREG